MSALFNQITLVPSLYYWFCYSDILEWYHFKPLFLGIQQLLVLLKPLQKQNYTQSSEGGAFNLNTMSHLVSIFLALCMFRDILLFPWYSPLTLLLYIKIWFFPLIHSRILLFSQNYIEHNWVSLITFWCFSTCIQISNILWGIFSSIFS